MKGDKVYLQHILDSILAIEKFTENISREEFSKNDMVQSAVIRKIEIMGEAVKNLVLGCINQRNISSDLFDRLPCRFSAKCFVFLPFGIR